MPQSTLALYLAIIILRSIYYSTACIVSAYICNYTSFSLLADPDSSTLFIGSTDTTLYIPAPLYRPHPLLRWFHNGLEIKSHQGLSALNQTSEVTSVLYGIYQLFIEQLDGTLTELTLTRALPYGEENSNCWCRRYSNKDV